MLYSDTGVYVLFDGTDETLEVRSRYVIGADGAGSRVRQSLGIEMQGPPRIQSFLMIHFGANLREMVRDRPGVLHFVLDPEAGGAFIAHDVEQMGDALLNISEAIISANLGQPINIDRYHSLRASVERLGLDQ